MNGPGLARFFDALRAQRRAVLAALGALGVAGVALAVSLPVSLLPDITFPRITVIADSGERPAVEMERAVTRPLESMLRRVPTVREMRSTTSRGSTEINLDCDWGVNMNLALQQVQAQVDAVRERLPPGTSVDSRIMSPTLFPVYAFSMVSDTRSLSELRDLAVLRLEPELARLPGVAEVVVQGGRRPEARVTLDPAALEARGLDAAGVADAIRGSAELQSVGLLDANRELYLGLADARPASLEALGRIPIPVGNGVSVPLAELGRIGLETAPEHTRYSAQSREAVLVSVLRRPSASTVGLSHAVDRWLARHRGALPPDVRLQVFYDQSELVGASVDSVRDSLLVGALMAIFIIVVFLRSLRLGLAAAVALPGSIALTLLGFALTRQSLNMMTLGGIAAAVGLVLDDAIVVVEHVAHWRVHRPTGSTLSDAMAEILPALFGSSLCTIAIFVPFMFLGGVAGAFFRVLALAMTFMLASSLLLCVTVVPRLVRADAAAPAPASARPAAGGLERVLRHVTRHGWVGVVVPLVFVAAIIPLGLTLGTGFLPEMDEGSLILDYVAPAGTSVTETDRMLREVEREIERVPEIGAWSRRIGDQLGFFITEPNIGDYVLRLKKHRRRSAEDIADALRRRIETTQPALEIEFGQLIEDVVGDLTTNPQPIEVRLLGPDRPGLEERARQVARILESVPGVVDVKDGVVVSGPNVSVVPGAAAQRLGLGAPELARAVEPYLQGVAAGDILRGARSWPVRVVLPAVAGAGPEALAAVRVPVAPGRWARLGDLATLRIEPGETEIVHDNARPMVAATARLSGRDIGSAMAEIRPRIRREVALGPDMSVRYAGLWAEQQTSFRGLAGVLVGATIAVLLILLAAFRSWRSSAAVLLVVAASLAGVFLALHAGGATFNIASFVGAIMVVGIVAENAYFLVAAHQQALARGSGSEEAAFLAARRRARPILMTTAAGVAALAPLALGFGAGSALLRPLAIAVVGGFVTSSPLLLAVLPSLLARMRPSAQ